MVLAGVVDASIRRRGRRTFLFATCSEIVEGRSALRLLASTGRRSFHHAGRDRTLHCLDYFRRG